MGKKYKGVGELSEAVTEGWLLFEQATGDPDRFDILASSSYRVAARKGELIRMKRLSILLAVAAMAASLTAQTAVQSGTAKPTKVAKAKSASPWVGTWKMDVPNSQLHMPLKAETVIITAASNKRLVYHGSMMDDKGKTQGFHYTGMLGKDAPSYMGGKESGKESWKMTDANTLSTEQEAKDGAKTTGDCNLTDDGKTMTCKWHTAPKSGDGWDEVYVMHKQ